MLLLPVATNSDQKKLPTLCIILIAMNCLVFFFIQAKDTSLLDEAYGHYEESGLFEIELAAYQKYLAGAETDRQARALSPEEKHNLAYQMFRDNGFTSLLESNRIITPQSPQFPTWRPLRTSFEERLGKVSIYKYGYSPRERSIPTLLSCIFFHGDFMHLLGNMVFLYLVGAILELAIGPLFFLLLYLVTGIAASALFGFIYPTAPGPLIGASGAIAGLMGAYGMVFGLRKIRVFYSLGFYFNYAMIPALSLFPFWLANEFFQLYTNTNSNVAYMAHIGGLLSGMAIGSIYKTFLGKRIDSLFTEAEKEEKIGEILEEGLKKLGEFELADARKSFSQILELEPNNLQAIQQLYQIDKSLKDTERLHQSAHRLLESILQGPEDEFLQAYEDYSTQTTPRLSLSILERLSFLYLGKGQSAKAAPLVAQLYKKNRQSSKLPGYLLRLGKELAQDSREEDALKCFRAVAKQYPTSQEAVLAAKILKQQESTILSASP